MFSVKLTLAEFAAPLQTPSLLFDRATTLSYSSDALVLPLKSSYGEEEDVMATYAGFVVEVKTP